jgi:predicted DNA-binding transcriptional regulator AlpA
MCSLDHYRRLGFDFDFIDDTTNQSLFQRFASQVRGHEGQIRCMTLPAYRNVLDIGERPKQQASRKSHGFRWIVARNQGRRYCPLCFASDDVPYLRLVWRLSFVPICLKHQIYLASECSRCHSELNPLEANRHYDIGKCSKCGTPLSQSRVANIDHRMKDPCAISRLLQLLDTGAESSGFPGTTIRDLFECLKVIIQLMLATSPKALQDTRTTHSLVERAWRLMHNDNELGDFVGQHQALFNLVTTYRYPYHCPRFLSHFKVRVRPPEVDQEFLREKARELARKNELSIKKLAKVTGYSYSTLYHMSTEKKSALGFDARARLGSVRQKRISDVRRAIADLTAKGQYPTLVKVYLRSGHACSARNESYLNRLVVDAQQEFRLKRSGWMRASILPK